MAISKKEKEALYMAAKGMTFKEIAAQLNVSQSAVEKRLIPLYKRFNVKSLPHLISFAHTNHIL
ncbi:response regulator transcription factor [Tenacibaculum finnmarkense]|uniref:response regulator transcription factor n=1 Tax=Tenacibaculum finnmarkense TaxID=2781243 RepID=UPI0021D405DF|nr:helix-turn-helix domain-containing protein [Tenacibaculum finnmarkense]MCD8411645.1 helix-turn-helix domain-containing protein [Tenacibaculum finnmarkense genomovar ulcerans]